MLIPRSCFTGGNTRQACGDMHCSVGEQPTGVYNARGKCAVNRRHRRKPILGGRDLVLDLDLNPDDDDLDLDLDLDLGLDDSINA
jgi:hypothetical protein